MAHVWLASALWLALALLASVISIRVAMSVALIEIVVGAVAGNVIGLTITDWVNFLSGFGAILLTFLAGTEIDGRVIRKHLGASVGLASSASSLPTWASFFMRATSSPGPGPRRRSRGFRYPRPPLRWSMP
jgi:Kef-type K+ transport system membrane component KefB